MLWIEMLELKEKNEEILRDSNNLQTAVKEKNEQIAELSTGLTQMQESSELTIQNLET